MRARASLQERAVGAPEWLAWMETVSRNKWPRGSSLNSDAWAEQGVAVFTKSQKGWEAKIEKPGELSK